MSDCCIKDLGRVPHNQPVNTLEQAPDTGTYKVMLNYQGGVITREVTLDAGDDILIPGPFNEEYTYTLEIIKPDGEKLVTYEGCTTLAFTTYISLIVCEHECPTDEELTDEEYYS